VDAHGVPGRPPDGAVRERGLPARRGRRPERLPDGASRRPRGVDPRPRLRLPQRGWEGHLGARPPVST
jgi:hypothetical protein